MRTAPALLLAALLLPACNKAGEEPKPEANAVKPTDPPAPVKPPPANPPAKVPAEPPPKVSPKPPAPAGKASPELLAAVTKLNGYESSYGRKPGEPVHFQFRNPGPADADLATLRAPLLASAVPVHLNLNGATSVSDAGVARLADIPMLRRLSIGDTKVSDAGLKTVGALDLDELYLSCPAVTDAGVAHLAKLTKLKRLGLYGKGITGAAFAHLADMTELEELNASPSEFDDARLKPLAKLTKLKAVSVGGSGLTDAGLAAIKNMTELRELRVDSEKITAAGAAHLTSLSKLQKLTVLRWPGFTGDALAPLAGMPELRELELIYTPAIDKVGGAHVGKLKGLKKLRFGAVTADGLAGIAGLTGLEDLQLFYTSADDAGLAHLAGLTGLKSLSLSNTRVTDAGIKSLSKLTALKELGLGDNPKVTDAALTAVAAIPNLEKLWANRCAITGSGFKDLARHAKLKQLYLSGNPITDANVMALKDMPALEEVDFTGTKVSEDVALELKTARPKLRVRDVSGSEVSLTAKPPRPRPKVEDLTKAEPDFKLTAEAFYKEYQDDKGAAARKYKGKVIELTGEVDGHGRNISEEPYLSLKVEKQLIGVMCFTADEQPWGKAVKGQKVKLKGRWPEFTIAPALVHCALVETGEYKGVAVTAAELAKEYAADGATTVKKYDGKFLVLSGEVASKDFNSAGASTVWLKVDGKTNVGCSFTAFDKEQVRVIKVGQKLTVVGEFTLNSEGRDEVTVYFCQSLTNP